MHTDVELEQQLRREPAPVERARKALGRRAAVDGDRQLDTGRGDVSESFPFRLAERWIVDEQPRHARLLEHLRLAGLRDGEAGGAELELAAADLR